MSYLIQESVVFAKGRNHGAYLAHAGTAPQGSHDTLYLWNMVTHPTSGEAALHIPNPSVDTVDDEGNVINGNVTQSELDSLVETLPEGWYTAEEI